MIKYGLISKKDSETLEATIDLICNELPSDSLINFCEVGVYGGDTANGLYEYAESKKKLLFTIGVDNKKDNEKLRFLYNNLFIGDADEMSYKIENESQDILLLDACHCLAHTISNFFSYASKIKKGGYFCFHDTGKHIKPFKDFQHGDKENSDAYISVRKALDKIGLLPKFNPRFTGDKYLIKEEPLMASTWKLVFDEADENDEAGGICVFKKL